MGLFDFLGKSKRDKESAQLIAGVSFEECLEDLQEEIVENMLFITQTRIKTTSEETTITTHDIVV